MQGPDAGLGVQRREIDRFPCLWHSQAATQVNGPLSSGMLVQCALEEHSWGEGSVLGLVLRAEGEPECVWQGDSMC